jgi:hypothetical protein
MLTKMTEEDWVLVLEVFDACRSRRGDKGLGRPQVSRSLALFHGPQHYVASAAGRVRLLEQHLEALLALEPRCCPRSDMLSYALQRGGLPQCPRSL